MKSLRFFWLWSTADQKNSEAAPLRCAMAACCHPSNSPSTAPALTFWPNSESKNCRGHPGIGFCQYETLTCPTLKRICLEKYDTISLTISTSTSQVLLATAGCIFGLQLVGNFATIEFHRFSATISFASFCTWKTSFRHNGVQFFEISMNIWTEAVRFFVLILFATAFRHTGHTIQSQKHRTS